jgi:putative ABC transport system permease protein
MRLTQWIDEFRDDVKLAGRQLRSSAVVSFIAAITLALGIGANSAIFALVDRTLLRPLPFHNPDRLVMAWEQSDPSPRGLVSPLNLLDWNERNRTFDNFAAFIPNIGGMVMNGADGTAETVTRQWVTAGFFDVLGVRPIAGRTFLAADDAQRANVVVLSETFWQSRFNADPMMIGRAVRLDGQPYTVVGVVPKDFQLLGRTSMWALIALSARRPPMRTAYFFQAIGRMKPEVTLQAASADMANVAEGLAREFPTTNKGRSVVLEPLHDALIGRELRLTSMLFLGVVGFVLLICCANVANLLLARATARTRELAIRSALGAGRRRMMRQLLTESLVLSTIGCVLGIGVGAAILKVAPSVIPQGLLPEAVTLAFDPWVVAFCAAAAIFAGLLCGLAPAWQSTKFSTAQVIASDSRTATGRGGGLRSLLVVGEVATAVLLLFGASLLMRTLMAVEGVDRGYRAESILTMLVDPLGSQYPTDASTLQFFDAVEQEIRALPGVRSVAWASTLPLGPSSAGESSFEIVGDPPLDDGKRPSADFQIVSPMYFSTLDLPITAGRGFNASDAGDSVAVCMVNEAFVRRHLQGRSPIGVRVAMRSSESSPEPPVVREIVGVARQLKGRLDEIEDLVQIYVPLAQNVVGDIYMLVAPKAGRAVAFAPAVRAAIGRIDKDQLVSVRDVKSLEDVAREGTARHRFRAVMVGTFAGLALLLAMVGVFGILAYSVQQRLRDLGVRRALGATTGDVLRLVIGNALRVIVAGVVIGLVLSTILGRLLTTILFGVEPLDPITFAAVTVALVIAAALSIAGPAWRATRIDPADALRSQ